MWFTLADCIASKLLTGKTPKVIEALAFKAGKPQRGLHPVSIAGNQAYLINPTKHDFYKLLIELRNDVKEIRDKASGTAHQAFDIEQNALKIAANATSYGIFVEVNVKDRAKRQGSTVHSSTSRTYEVETSKSETPGRHFHPLLATLITGAARLMLAIAERLVLDRNLEWAFCDTDSIAIARPPDMPETEFHARVDEVVAWFSGLNPYRFSASILKIEDVNFGLDNPTVREPLFCWAVSAKRYALFNLDGQVRPILRKASAHGLGHLRAPYDASKPANGIPAPIVPFEKIGAELWQHDLWWKIISTALANKPDQVDLNYHPALNQPAVSRYAATTPKLLKWFFKFNESRSIDQQVKPFGFLYALHANALNVDIDEVLDPDRPNKRRSRKQVKPVAPYDKDLSKAVAQCIDRETGQPIPVSLLKTYKQVLAQYHLHPELKFTNGDYLDRGVTKRRYVYATGIRNIGKEANEWEPQFYLGFDEDEMIDYGLAPKSSKAVVRDIAAAIRKMGQRKVARESGVSRRTVERLVKGEKIRPSTFAKIRRTLTA
jgi:DNA-binding Xre family transcriptional regulator